MLRRREFLASASVLAILVGCSQSGSATTITGIIDELKKQCAFTADWAAIAKVIATIVAGFNAGAGAATAVAADVAKTVVDAICNAVKAQVAQMQLEKKALPSTLTVLVNGVEVQGKYGA